MKLAILGAGKMGVWFAKFFKDRGYCVILADRKKDKLVKLQKELNVEVDDFVGAVQKAERILICVSINAFEDIIKLISPVIRKDQIVMDICSVKASPVKIMHKYIQTGLKLGTHPAFGPGSSNLKDKAFILTPINKAELTFAQEFKEWLEKEGARVFIMTPEHHDELMSVVLGLPHFIGVVTCSTLVDRPDFLETKDVAGTTYKLLFTLAEVAALENPDLFATLQLSLPKIENIEHLFLEKAKEWIKTIQQKNSEELIKKMEELKRKITTLNNDHSRSYELMYKMIESTET